MSTITAARLVPTVVRRWLLQQVCDDVGAIRVCSGFRINNSRLTIGDNTFINDDVVIDCNAPVSIGSGVSIGPGCKIVTSSHLVGPPRMRRKGIRLEPVSIGDGAWLATAVLVMPGVSIGEGCIIGAGSVVTRDCAPNGFYAGNPARRIKDLPV